MAEPNDVILDVTIGATVCDAESTGRGEDIPMAVRVERRRGKRVLVIDITYRNADGRWVRFRRDSKAPTKAAAQAEERRILERIALTGSPYEASAPVEETKPEMTYARLVEEYRSDYVPAELKHTTARGYNRVLDCHLLPRFGGMPLSSVTGLAATKLDHDLAKRTGKHRKCGRNTRNNIQIVLRSTLQFAVGSQHLGSMPSGLPKLKQPEKVVLTIPTDEDVEQILKAALPYQRRAFALIAYGGLRPNEARALAWPEVSPQGVGGRLTVRVGRSYGQSHTPKTGPRVVPIAAQLGFELSSTPAELRKGFVALSRSKKPWGQYGMSKAFKRIAAKLEMPKAWTLYYLRHYAITSWLRKGIRVHVVQRMAGHKHLATTEKYVHLLNADLDEAARILGNIVATEPDAAE